MNNHGTIIITNGKYLGHTVPTFIVVGCITTCFGVKTPSSVVQYILSCIQILGVKHLLHSRAVEKTHNLKH